jgi:hypothetical protein
VGVWDFELNTAFKDTSSTLHTTGMFGAKSWTLPINNNESWEFGREDPTKDTEILGDFAGLMLKYTELWLLRLEFFESLIFNLTKNNDPTPLNGEGVTVAFNPSDETLIEQGKGDCWF